MHEELVKLYVASVQRRHAQGDQPREPTLPTEVMEFVILAQAAQIADMQADVLEHWSGKVAISLEEAERLNALPDLEGVKEALRPFARIGAFYTDENPAVSGEHILAHVGSDTEDDPRVARIRDFRRARAALQALEAKNV